MAPRAAGGRGQAGWEPLLWKLWLPALCSSMCRLLARKMRSLRGYSSGPYRRSFCGDTARQGTPSSRRPPARPEPPPEPHLQHPGLEQLLLCGRERGRQNGAAPARGAPGGPGRAEAEPSPNRAEPSPNRAEPAQASPCQSPPALPVPLYLRPRAPRRRRGPAARPRSAARASPWPGRAEPGRTGRSGAHPG